MSTYTPTDRRTDRETQSANTRKRAEDSGLIVHTQYAAPDVQVFFTFEGIDEQGSHTGSVWADVPIVANRTEHWLCGRYRLTNSCRTWISNKAQDHSGPCAHFSSFPALDRLDGGNVTEKSRLAIGQMVGAAIQQELTRAPETFAREAKDNARELAAQDVDRKARYEYERAARILESVGKLEARAAAIRAGADYDAKDPAHGVRIERH